MNGYKTWIGGLLAIAAGFYLIASGKDCNHGIDLIVTGFSVIGIGHKIEKRGKLL